MVNRNRLPGEIRLEMKVNLSKVYRLIDYPRMRLAVIRQRHIMEQSRRGMVLSRLLGWPSRPRWLIGYAVKARPWR